MMGMRHFLTRERWWGERTFDHREEAAPGYVFGGREGRSGPLGGISGGNRETGMFVSVRHFPDKVEVKAEM